MNDDIQPLEARVSGEFLVRRKRRRLGATTDPGLGFYVPSSPTSVDANPSSETAEPRSASSENYKIPQNLSQCHSPMEVDIQPPPGTPRESSSSPTPTPMLSVEGYLRRSAGGSRKRQKLKHIGLANNPRDTSPALHHAEGQSPPTITQPLTSTAPRRKRRTRSRPSRVKTTLVKGKAYRARSQKPKAVIDDLVRAALSTHVDVDEEFLEDGRNPPCRLDTRTTNGLTQNTPATVRRRNFVHPYKTQPFPCEPSLGNAPVDLELGRHPRKPMSAWEGTLVLSKLDIRVPTSTVTPRRKGRPIQGPSPSRVRGRYPKLPLTPLSPTPMPTSRGHTVPRNRLRLRRGPPGQPTHPEVAAIPITSTEEITSPHSEPGPGHIFGSSTLNPAIQASNREPQPSSHGGRARASGAAVMDPTRPEPQANLNDRKVRFSSPLDPDREDETPDCNPVILVPNSSDPNLANRASPDPSNHAPQSSSPPPFPFPRLLFVQSHPRSEEHALRYRVPAIDSDMEREPGKPDSLVPPITVSTQPRTADDNREVVSGGLKLNGGKNLEGREEAENVDQHQPGADTPFGSQGPAETLRGNAHHYIGLQGVHPHNPTNVLVSDVRQGESLRRSPVASQPIGAPDRVDNSKSMKPLKSHFDRLTNNSPRVEPEARSKLQAEAEGDEEEKEATGTSKEVTDSNGPPHSTPFPPLGRMLSLLDGAGPSRSADGFGKLITRRPRRSTGGNRIRKVFQTQSPTEVANGWQSEGARNVDARPGAGFSKSDDFSFFAGL